MHRHRRHLAAAAWLTAAWSTQSSLLRIVGAKGVNGDRRRRPPPPSRAARRDGPPRTGEEEDEEQFVGSALSYFERHGLVAPPSSRRRTQTTGSLFEPMGEEGADEEGDDGIVDAVAGIVRDAKRGLNAAARLRRDLLGLGGAEDAEQTYYDKHSYPWEYVWLRNGTAHGAGSHRRGVPVEMNMSFHRVFDVDVVTSVMDLVVWIRLIWIDPRLSWDPSDYDGLDTAWFWIGDGGAGGETSEIWTPDVELWNLETGLADSLQDTYARVKSDGTVWWSRPGRLRPTCKFDGLSYFPFDRLMCTMEFGSWALNGKYVWMEPYDKGYRIGGSGTAGESYEQYSLAEEDAVSVVQHIYHYESDPEADWPVLMYKVTVVRSWQPYVRGYIACQVILNVIGFSAFWLPPSCGERMSLSATMMLASITAEIVVAANLPAAAEITWFSRFSMTSLSFAFLSLIECVLVLYFYYKREVDLVPTWYASAKGWCLARQAKKSGEPVNATSGFAMEKIGSHVDASDGGERNETHVKKSAPGLTAPHDEAPAEDWVDNGAIHDNDGKVEPFSNNSDIFDDKKDPPEAKRSDQSVRRMEPSVMRAYNDQGRHSIRSIVRDADDFFDEEELENNMKWKHVAARIDDFARFWIPLVFVVSLSIIFAEVSYL